LFIRMNEKGWQKWRFWVDICRACSLQSVYPVDFPVWTP
jgi:hypothetical protein